MSTATRHIETEKRTSEHSRSKLVPALRFKAYVDGWKILTLKNLIKDLQSGISVNSEDRPIANDLEFGILKTSAVANGVFKKNENKKIVDEEITKAKLNPTKNEIIISRMNTPQLVGESGYIAQTYPNLFVPDRLWQTITYADKCYNRWLSYFLITDRVRYNLKSIATGTSGTMKNISKPNFLSIKVNCPSLPEQQKIASFLSAVDEKIQQLTKKKELLEQYKKGVMQQLFRSTGSGHSSGHLRFKDENGNPYPDWKEKKLSKCIEFIAGYAFKSIEMKNEPSTYQILKMSNVYKSKLQLERSPSYWEELDEKQAKFLLRKKDILLTLTGTVGKMDYGYSVVIPENNKFLLNQRLVCLRCIDGISDGGFINNLVKTSRFFYFFFGESKGGTGNQTNVGIEDLRNIKLLFPTLPEQQKIAIYLSSIDTKIESVTHQITQIQTFKKGLLQQMFVAT